MTNEELVALIKQGVDVGEHMLTLYEQTKDYIRKIAYKYHFLDDIEDLEQEGYLALYSAIDGYNADEECKFLTYAEYWIKQRILFYVSQKSCCIRIPKYAKERLSKYKRFCSTYVRKHGCDPSDWTVARHLDLDLEQVESIKRVAHIATVVSLDVPLTNDNGDSCALGDTISDTVDMELESIERLYQEQLRAALWKYIECLPSENIDILNKHYVQNMTLSDIARDKGISYNDIRRIEQGTMRNLRKYEVLKQLRPFLEDCIYNAALKGNGVERFRQTWTSSTERVALEL